MNRFFSSLPQCILSRSLPAYKVKHLQSFVIKPINYQVGCQLLHTSKVLKYCSNPTASTNVISQLEGSAKLVKDVIVFKYENPRFFKYLNIFAISQFFCWNYLAHFSFTSLRDSPVQDTGEDVSWWRKINLGENKYRNSLSIMCVVLGYGLLCVSWMYILRSVRYLVLRKDGSTVTFVTYTPYGHNRIMDVPLKCVSAQQSRPQAKVQLPLKVKNKAFFYILDMRGEFLNARLYDFTVGLRRKF
ncbi:Transmembrane protein [Pseudolycoriella hygida]|uniref:Transmembrane protein n=1 Tax=Pseudolycoriella hygida TaxID=35572 RepID=A0A9Q0RUH3_9DIPT|nr:Transmembrane protein [Pseudolycoriella hygida]